MLGLVLGLALFFASEPAAAGLRDSFAEIESLALGGPVPAPEQLVVGRAEIRPSAGAEVRPLLVGDRVCGVLIDGAAEWMYRIEDRWIAPTVRHNLKSVRGLNAVEKDGALVLVTNLSGAAVWGWDLGLEVGSGETVDDETTVEAADGPEAPQWLRTVFEKKLTAQPARALLVTDRNGDDGHRWAVFDSDVGYLTLDVDPRPGVRAEALDRLVKPSRRVGPYRDGSFVTEGIATQPIDRSWWEGPEVPFASTDVKISLSNRRGREASVESTTQIQSMREGLRALTFTLRSAAYGENAEYRNEIETVEVDGKPASWLYRYGTLLVELPEAIGPGATTSVRVVAVGGILDRPSGDNYWRLVGSWYPVPADGALEWASYDIEIEVPEPFVPIGPGEVVERRSADGMAWVRSRVAGPMSYAAVVAGKYKTITDERHGFRVHVSAYAFAKEKDARRLATVIHATKQCLESWLDVPYPFPDLQVVEINSWGWGQAPPGVIFITQEAFNSAAKALVDDGDRFLKTLTSRSVNERVAHEVAHGWFPHVAKRAAWEENWLSESLADYASAVCIHRTMADAKRGERSFKRQLNDWQNLSRDAGDHASVFLAGHLGWGDRLDASTYRALLYGRGPLVLHKIRLLLQEKHGEEKGDNYFFAWLRSYMKNFDHKVAETRHLIAILNQITGEDWQPFFERYIYGTESPDIS